MQQIVASTRIFFKRHAAAEIPALCFGKFFSLAGRRAISSLLLKTQGNKATQFFLSQTPIYCYCCCYSCWVLSKCMITWCASVLGSNCLPKFAYRIPTTLAVERDGEYIRNIDGNGNDCETSQPKDYRVTFPSTQVLSLPKRTFSLAVLTKGTKLAEYAFRSCFLSTGTGFALKYPHFLSSISLSSHKNKKIQQIFVRLQTVHSLELCKGMEEGDTEKDGVRSQHSRCLEKSKVLTQEELNR